MATNFFALRSFQPKKAAEVVVLHIKALVQVGACLKELLGYCKNPSFKAISLEYRSLETYNSRTLILEILQLQMMIQTSREGGALGTSSTNEGKARTLLNNPRIVRVSPSFGGKDRHSKVRTIRGLRDRRVRLSVPTAIQLYGLQDKLGFNQPSKVVDWLIRAAQHEIDKLPPLEMLQRDHRPCPLIPRTANPNIVSLANGECISNPRSKGKEVALRGGSFLGHHGVVGSENSELINIPYFQWDTANNGYLPMTILSSYLAAASNKEQEAEQYGQFLSTTTTSAQNNASPNEAFRSL